MSKFLVNKQTYELLIEHQRIVIANTLQTTVQPEVI